MPRSIEPIHARRAAQLKALAQVRNTLQAPHRAMVAELVDLPVENMQDWQLELIDTLASTYLCEVA